MLGPPLALTLGLGCRQAWELGLAPVQAQAPCNTPRLTQLHWQNINYQLCQASRFRQRALLHSAIYARSSRRLSAAKLVAMLAPLDHAAVHSCEGKRVGTELTRIGEGVGVGTGEGGGEATGEAAEGGNWTLVCMSP